MTPIILFVVFIIIAAVGAVIKLANAKVQSGANPPARADENDDEWGKAFSQAADMPSPARTATDGAAQRSENAVKHTVDRTAPRDALKKQEVYSQGHHQSHCNVDSHESKDKYRVEKVPVMNSIGGKSDEGCKEHYDVRFVKVDEETTDKRKELTELQKAIVYGEVLNNPAFKRRGYFRNR